MCVCTLPVQTCQRENGERTAFTHLHTRFRPSFHSLFSAAWATGTQPWDSLLFEVENGGNSKLDTGEGRECCLSFSLFQTLTSAGLEIHRPPLQYDAMTDGLTNGLWAGDPDEPIHDLLAMKHSATITQLLAFAQISLPLSLIAVFYCHFFTAF